MTIPLSTRDPAHARGTLAAATRDSITLRIPGTEYRLELVVSELPGTPIEKKLSGIIRAQARRVDVVKSGGRYVEPIFGRPRRVQGAVIAANTSDNSITVDAGVPIICTLTDPRQRAEQFQIGDFVSFDVMPGTRFTPLSVGAG